MGRREKYEAERITVRAGLPPLVVTKTWVATKKQPPKAVTPARSQRALPSKPERFIDVLDIDDED
jgi:hypothetical protein